MIVDKHTATACVGKDIIEDAEYILYKHTTFEKEKTFKDKLEDFWFVVTTPFVRTKHLVRRMYWKVRYGFQRMFKGYDIIDTFDIYYKFIDRYSKILTEFKNNHEGYPINLQSNDEWNNVLDEMVYHLRYMNEETVTKELEKDVPEDWTASYKTVHEIMDRHKDKFFKLFSEHFYSLWY